MCTLTFIPCKRGFLLAMNRDESRLRPAPDPPSVFLHGASRAVYPHEDTGGTWIAVNDSGIALALLNWKVPYAGVKQRSRGLVIPQLIASMSLLELRGRADAADLTGMLPFRLVAVSSGERSVRELRFDGEERSWLRFDWERRHWFSSGRGDKVAAAMRGIVCEARWRDVDAGSQDWIRMLHRSHEPEKGAFSICVHREDAATVSYTEIEHDGTSAELRYAPGTPCETPEFSTALQLPVRAAQTPSLSLP